MTGKYERKWSGAKVVLVLTLLLSFGAAKAAQPDQLASEVGFVFSATNFASGAEPGIGARFLHNYNRNIGFEFQGAFYPVDQSVSLIQGTFQLKATHRMESRSRVNVFGVLGPSFLVTDPKDAARRTRYGLNAGGGVEAILRPNLAVRADLTDFALFTDGDSSHNFDFKLALMYRW